MVKSACIVCKHEPAVPYSTEHDVAKGDVVTHCYCTHYGGQLLGARRGVTR